MHITLRQLEIFKAVAQSGRVTAAAENLHISQPAASMALSELEKHLGSLFDRSQGAGLTLNDAGRALLPKACEMTDRAHEIEGQFSQGKYEYGTLKVNASSTIGNNLMPVLLSDYRKKNQGIRTELVIDNTREIEKRILNFEIDLAIVEGNCIHPDIEVTGWKEDRLVIVCAPEHPMADSRNLNLQDLADEQWFLREPGSGTRELFDEIIASQLGTPKVAMVLNRSEAIKQAVKDNLGIACMSRIAVQRALKQGNLKTIDVKDLTLRRQFYLLRHKKKYCSEILNEFYQFITNWQMPR